MELKRSEKLEVVAISQKDSLGEIKPKKPTSCCFKYAIMLSGSLLLLASYQGLIQALKREQANASVVLGT